jgi:hypothetical protein
VKYLIIPKLLDVLEGALEGGVENDEDPMGTLVVCACDGLETFLTGGIPDLQPDGVRADGD